MPANLTQCQPPCGLSFLLNANVLPVPLVERCTDAQDKRGFPTHAWELLSPKSSPPEEREEEHEAAPGSSAYFFFYSAEVAGVKSDSP